jgi:serine protease Do/serine protease DegQ
MRPRLVPIALVALLAAGTQAAPTAAQIPQVNGQGLPSLAPLVRQVGPAVVNIAIRGRAAAQAPASQDARRFFGLPDQPSARQREVRAAGSGVIIDAREGYILTNAHVIDRADDITVTLSDGRPVKATRVGLDLETDVGVIKIPAERLTAAPMGDSDKLEVGDYVLAIGNPFGIGQTVTTGIVSGLRRNDLGIEDYEDFIQTDASINPGNSGGPLINLRGEVIGINTAIVGPTGGSVGIGFAIPINMARSVVEQLTRNGGVRRGQIGVQLQELTPDLAQAMSVPVTGALIARVEPNSPAQRAGFREKDIVIAMNGIAIRNSAELRNRVALAQIGDNVSFEVRREGRTMTLRATLAARPPQAERAAESDRPPQAQRPRRQQQPSQPQR